MNNILVIAKGSDYIDTLLLNYKFLEGKANITVYTDNVNKVRKQITSADVREYKSKTFKYFDKYLLTNQLVKEKQEPVMYIDVGRITDKYYLTLINFNPNEIKNIFTNSNWEGINSAKELYNFDSPYTEYGYYNNILEYFESNKVNLNKVVPLLERVFILPYKDSTDKVINELENLRTIFESNSTNKQNVYAGVGNGEGLALGYALVKTDTKSFFLRDIPIQPTSII
jgi:hypothetical protein